MNHKPKLELTWIGKDRQPKLELRILIEDPEKSYGQHHSPISKGGTQGGSNMLIYGDNLLALKALEQDFAGAIKCIYIDPPFNTGSAFEHYDDSLEHSIWLQMMRDRFNVLVNLLKEDGFLVVHLDDTEMPYCKVLLDEIFGRNNYLNTISLKTLDPSGFKSTGNKIFSTTNYLLVFVKDRSKAKTNTVYIEKNYDEQYSQYLINKSEYYSDWKWKSIKEFLAIDIHGYTSVREAQSKIGREFFEEEVAKFAIENADSVFQTAAIGGGALLKRKATIEKSKKERGRVFIHPDEDLDDFYILNGRQIIFFSKRLVKIDGTVVPGEVITDFWTDISWNGIASEGDVSFKNGKKPEALIHRILKLCSNEDDWVLDSFLGSGTTAAVSHKMKRKWIGIELGEHCHTHCIPRLQKVCDGTDQGGISQTVPSWEGQGVGWKGGGGFKYYYLAPSLLKQDKYNNWVINPEYNGNMLASAMAKHEGFRYQPDEQIYWKQGQSTEKDFIYTTTQFITVETLDRIHEEMQNGESLLICCKSFSKACEDRYSNITVKKIPKMLLGRCEFGKEDYSLNIINMPVDPNEPEFIPQGIKQKPPAVKKKNGRTEPNLFNTENVGEE